MRFALLAAERRVFAGRWRDVIAFGVRRGMIEESRRLSRNGCEWTEWKLKPGVRIGLECGGRG